MLKTLQIAALALALGALALGGGPALAAGSSSDDEPAKKAGLYETAVERIEQMNYTAAVPLLEQVVDKEPENADAWNYLGFALRKLNRVDEAFAAYDQALRIDPEHAGANEYLGELYLMTGDLAQAEAQLATLESTCGMSCSEYQQLKTAIESFKQGS